MTSLVYPDYQDSGVEWLGPVPSHWRIVPLKKVAAIVNGYPFDSKAFNGQRGYPLIRIRDLGADVAETYYDGEFIEAAAITSDDVLIGMDGDFNVGRWLGRERALLNQRVCCIRSLSELVTKYLEYALPFPLKAINDVTYSTTVKHLSSYQVEKIRFALPPNDEEQFSIVAFLDRETGKIDALVEEQKRLIELLKEKRQAVVSHAVTKGLNPDAPMKDSGVEWLGAVPEHWEVKPLRWFFRFVKRQDCEHYPVLSVYRDYGVLLKSSRDDNFNKTPDDLSKYQTVEPGDLVVNKMKAWQGSLGISELVGITSPDYAVFAPQKNMGSLYLNYLLRCKLLPDVYRSISNGIRPSQWRIEPDKLMALRVPLPPGAEQDDIAAYLDTEIAKADALIAEVESAIDLLQERRSALISAAVTGKIDVRGLVDETEAA